MILTRQTTLVIDGEAHQPGDPVDPPETILERHPEWFGEPLEQRTVDELEALLEEAHLSTNGLKADLVKRARAAGLY